MSSIIIEKEISNVDKKSFTAIDTSKASIGLSSASRKEIMKKLKKNRKQIKLQFMRRFPKIGVPTFKLHSKSKLGALENINKNNKVHELSMYDPNATQMNLSQSEECNFYPDHHRIKILWHFCLSLFLFAILFLIGSVIYLMARKSSPSDCADWIEHNIFEESSNLSVNSTLENILKNSTNGN